jgi:hypothetical protein
MMQDVSETTHAGVGLLLHAENGAVHVKTCVKDGAAYRDGRIQAGDVVVSVDSTPTLGLSVDEVRALVVGLQGTFVRISFERRTTGETFECPLLRGTPDYLDAKLEAISRGESCPATPISKTPAESPNNSPPMGLRSTGELTGLRSSLNRSLSRFESLRASSDGGAHAALNSSVDGGYSLDAEVVRLRNRVSELEAENRHTKEELHRTLEVCEIERENSFRYARELEMMQRKYTDHIREIELVLEHKDSLCRDTELQLQSQIQKGQEFGDMFRLGQEQVEARERYFAETRMKYESQLNELVVQVQAEQNQRELAEQMKQLAEKALEKLMLELERIKAVERTRRESEEKFMFQMMESNRRLHDVREHEDKTRTALLKNLDKLRTWQDKFFPPTLGSLEDETENLFMA